MGGSERGSRAPMVWAQREDPDQDPGEKGSKARRHDTTSYEGMGMDTVTR